VAEEALTGKIWGRLGRAGSKCRWGRLVAETGFDTIAWVGSLLVAAQATGALAGAHLPRSALWCGLPVMCVLVAGSGMTAGLYRCRYLRGSRDEVAGVVLAGFLAACCLVIAGLPLVTGRRLLAETVLGGAVLAVAAMLGARYLVFAARLRPRPSAPTAVNIIVFGAGEAGSHLIRRLATQSGAAYRPVAILDDDVAKKRLRIHGVPVLGGRGQLAEVAASTGATVLVIAIAGGSGRVIRELTEAAERCGLVPKVIPSVRELLTGGAQIEGVRDPRISDLLGRRAVTTDVASVREHIAGRRVLVTGAGGSIGAELCRQLHRLGPAELIMLDRDESALHAIQLALHGRALLDSDETVLADIRDERRVREVFGRFRPEIVFHAAALKHLPLLERWPAEALKSNVWGTLTVLKAAAEHGVRSFVNISTDKAANPACVLGYSKRITERLTAYMAVRTGGGYLSVRFGNVLGSRGSVLTALSAQVAAGGPVTVTDPDVSRYFMLADEAVHLVLQAAAIGRAGEVLVLDMGEPVRIADMARRLAASTGRDLDIVFTGLRPGEKLTEDRLGHGETDGRPCHPLISQVSVPVLDPGEVTGLDADADPAFLRHALERHAHGPANVGTMTIPPQERAAPAVREAHAELASEPLPRTVRRLAMRFGVRPAKFSQPRHQPVKQTGSIRVAAERSARRICHIVVEGVAEQRHALTSSVSTRQPAGERLAGRPRSDPLTAPDEFLQRESTRPRPRLGNRGIPEIVPGHRQHQADAGQVGRAYGAAAVRADLDPVRGHDRDDFRVRWVSAAHHPGRAHWHRHPQRGQPPREQRGRHRGPADVRRAQHEDAGRIGIIRLHMACRIIRDAVRAAHGDITGTFASSAFHGDSRLAAAAWCGPIRAGEVRHARSVVVHSRRELYRLNGFRRLSTCPGTALNSTVAALGVHSFDAMNAGRGRASGDCPVSGLPAAICRSGRKS
jgi:FlaA1/EpsC-like NDP-sugar epimerase